MKLLTKITWCAVIILVTHSLFTLFKEDKELCNDPDDLYNVAFLHDVNKVRAKMYEYGFTHVEFSSAQDDLALAGLFLDKHAQNHIPIQGTIIFCAGFHPGLKEGMTTFYEMLKDEPYNFLFFDARGHGESDGDCYSLSAFQNYGRNEYKDIIGALEFVRNYNHKHHINHKIILFGICAGAYHMIRALDELYQEDAPVFKDVHSLIIDSGWASLAQIGAPTINGELEYRLTSYGSFLIKYPLYIILNGIYYLLLYPWHKQCPSLTPMMSHINQPILFIHAKNDLHAPLEFVEEMLPNCKHCQTWWIEKSTHACHHLKFKQEYREKLKTFLHEHQS